MVYHLCFSPKGLFPEGKKIDLITGKVKKVIDMQLPATLNSGCMPRQWLLTDRYAIGAHALTFSDLESGKVITNRITRGGCEIGWMAANGLVYSFPKACGCYVEALRGFLALSGNDVPSKNETSETRLEKGVAFGGGAQGTSLADDWLTFRHDSSRSGVVSSPLPLNLKLLWEKKIDSLININDPLLKDWMTNPISVARLSQPVIAGETVFVSLTEAHQVVALEATTGNLRWRHTVGGRLDTPPTIHNGMALVGCRDGWVYCLRATDGKLIWRFRAAFDERKIVTFGQLESAWPVVGGVLVENNLAYFFAGRSTNIDGGIFGYAVDAQTGKLVWESRTQISGDANIWVSYAPKDQESYKKIFHGICDMPVSDGVNITMGGKWPLNLKTGRESKLTGKALRASYTLLDRSWHALSYESCDLIKKIQLEQQYGSAIGQLTLMSSNRIIVVALCEKGSEIFAKEKSANLRDSPIWSIKIPNPQRIEAMSIAGDIIFVAGPLDRLDRSKGGALWTISASDGKKLDEWKLPAPPAPEGIAIAQGKVFVATERGEVFCFGKKD